MPVFAWPWLALAALLPLLVALLPPARDGTGGALRVPFFAAARGWPGGQRTRSLPQPPWLLTLAWLALVLAAMRPQLLDETQGIPASGRDLMLAVDISGSMNETDMRHGSTLESRLDAVKRIAGDFIARRRGDRVGLVLFGTRAYLQAPLSFDGDTVRALLNEAEIGLAGQQTAIGDAIGLSIKRLRDRALDQRVLVLLTDGSNTAGELRPLSAARLAGELGLRIHTIGVGADQRTLQEIYGGQYQRAPDLDERVLLGIATLTGGRYFRARDQEELEQVYALLDELEPLQTDERRARPALELYPWPLALALLLSLAHVARALRTGVHTAARRRDEVAA